MTRKDSVRAATDSAMDSVRHAAEVVAPYASTAKDSAVHYATEARVRVAPKVSNAALQARTQARAQYATMVAPHVPPKLDQAAQRAMVQTRRAAREAARYTAPRVQKAMAAAQPVGAEAMNRSAAAAAALRGQVTAQEIQQLIRKHERRARTGRMFKKVAAVGMLAGAAFAAWKWWDKQANPDWLVEPPAATEVSEGPLMSVDGSVGPLDPEVEAKQAESESSDRNREDRP
ncbi:DUF5324 family protein [Streptomyces sp. NPDC093546]|uniref:DUF5324 family protein n=1 Tax=Streptomyces sp. NPDC093546 TaxID=3366040 RepID=UPI003803ECC7